LCDIVCTCGYRWLGVLSVEDLAICPECQKGEVAITILDKAGVSDEVMELPVHVHRIEASVEEHGRWCSSLVECCVCNHRWAACYPESADEDALECPNCHAMASDVIPENEDAPPVDMSFLNKTSDGKPCP
jgi:hypothetical protein